MSKPINKVIKVLVFSDLVLFSAWGLIMPILAIFILERIEGGDARVAGIAVGIYWLAQAIFQIPIARFLDKRKGEKDDFYALVIGMFLAALVPIGFIFVKFPWQVYLLQGVSALAMGFITPSWAGIFTRHIARGKEAFCWSLDSSAIAIGSGVFGIVGGIVAKSFGFTPIFIGVFILGIIAAFIVLLIKDKLLPSPKKKALPITKPII